MTATAMRTGIGGDAIETVGDETGARAHRHLEENVSLRARSSANLRKTRPHESVALERKLQRGGHFRKIRASLKQERNASNSPLPPRHLPLRMVHLHLHQQLLVKLLFMG
mmetsp:Transcript_16280/g.40100  ORF Transcript_16280/g.40100 Transcript_16280/m.40100 type:complete len:110 (-) Transcript_16280:416-745(-)